MDHLVFEVGTALVLVAIAALIASKLNFSIIPFLILVGMIVGPHAPQIGIINLRFIHSAELIEFLGRIGILFLLFYLGLEFSTSKLIRSGKSILIGGSVYIGINLTLGLLYPLILGFPLKETLIIAGIITVSSSAIVAKVLVDLRRTGNSETELILGIIMFEDIFLAVYLSTISGLILGESSSLVGTMISVLISLGYMLLFFIIARKAAPLLNKLLKISSDEIFIIVIFATLFFIAGFSETIHVAEAIGALLLGLVYSETDQAERMEHLVIPFRDFFGAIFFFSFGLSIDPMKLGGAVWLTLGAVLITIIGNFVAGQIAGKIAGLSHKASTNIGLTIVSRGEFSIIMANLGIAGGLMPILQPFSALYVLILAILGPILTKESKVIFSFLNRIFKWQKPSLSKQQKS
ncbi:cation:proton antiporter [Sporolactobacillus terrae]|uniref:Cation:proton antiporter n=1 Tax=Sporolactobacillus terrae TaxID=269673 RepID=A0A410DAE2_9BACL|nr:cation:proton antiporter [Sporolactobacillus terrae]QAA23085.1 cation:proton antiporter [Sporolactobacillus terrae]QAA26057.1 cation:proton antiporter [Sporolactobacillus terrae]UAK15150.1 cation:proton antiporter [Sporolactobacillus terrae]BBN99497.1 potassium transporter [Sporolactobacillus terrae]